MNKNIPHINKDELNRLLVSEETQVDSLSEEQLSKIETAANAFFIYEQAQNVSVDEAWLNVDKKIKNGKQKVKQTSNSRRIIIWVSAVAAVALALIVLYPVTNSTLTNSVVDNKIAYLTAQGGKVVLPDGSIVSLNENSTLRYPKQFAENERNVELSGEAFFEIKRDTLHPFIVKAAEAHVKVLGTTFSVNTHKNNRVEVIVATGKVEVWHSNFDKHVVITPGRKSIAFNEAEPVVLTADMNEIAWKTGLLKFSNCTLGYIAASLTKTYHKPIVLATSQLENLRLTATFDNQSLADVLSVIAQTHHLQIKTVGEGFSIDHRTVKSNR